MVRVVAPARSRVMVLEHDHSALIHERFERMGRSLTYGRHVDERDAFDSSSIGLRIEDLHEAFADPEGAAILTVIGGSTAMSCCRTWTGISWPPIPRSSAATRISRHCNGLHARDRLVTYSGPHWSSFGVRDHFDPDVELVRAGALRGGPDPAGARRGVDRRRVVFRPGQPHLRHGDGWWPLRPGEATGRLVGGNLCTLNLSRAPSTCRTWTAPSCPSRTTR